MKSLNSDVTVLLDKLYNLRGDESVLLFSMQKENEKAIETKERTTSLKSELQEKINELSKEETALAEEGEKFKEALKSFNMDDYKIVIDSLKLDFNPEKVLKEVEENLPSTVEKIAEEKQNASDELVKVEDEMNAAISKIEELDIRKDELFANQEKLNRYIDMALSLNINITREEITSLLAKFGFSEEEQREAAKILMFPEDGLFEYDKLVNEKPTASKSITEVIQEAKENSDEVIPKEEAKVKKVVKKEPIKKNLPKEKTIDQIKAESKPLFEESSEDEIIVEENKLSPREVLINLLSKLGFDYLDFTNNDFAKIIDNYDEKLITGNVNIMQNININKDVFIDNVELFYDKELEKKIKRLTEVGKLPQDIYLNPNVLTKYDYEELNNAIELLNENGLDPKSVPLMAY